MTVAAATIFLASVEFQILNTDYVYTHLQRCGDVCTQKRTFRANMHIPLVCTSRNLHYSIRDEQIPMTDRRVSRTQREEDIARSRTKRFSRSPALYAYRCAPSLRAISVRGKFPTEWLTITLRDSWSMRSTYSGSRSRALVHTKRKTV